MTVAFISMKGPYSLIGEAFGKLYGWIGEKGYIPAGPPVGVYLNVPGQVPDEELLWELSSPIAGDVAPVSPDERGLGVKRVEMWVSMDTLGLMQQIGVIPAPA